MKLTMEFQLPDELHEADRAYHAHEAWAAIDDALGVLRAYRKYGTGAPDGVINDVSEILHEARGRLE